MESGRERERERNSISSGRLSGAGVVRGIAVIGLETWCPGGSGPLTEMGA